MTDEKDLTTDCKEENSTILIAHEVCDFVTNITSLRKTFPITIRAVLAAFKKAQHKYEDFDKNNIIHSQDAKERALLVKADCYDEFMSLLNELQTYGLAITTIPRNYVVSLVSQYDAFLGRLLRAIFLAKPELLNLSEKTLTLSQLMEFDSIAAARESILEKEVEGVLRKSHSEQFQWMEQHFGISLRKGLDVWPRFVEITERRNLFVHTGGRVSTQYLKTCKEHECIFENAPTIGEELVVGPNYFEEAANVIFEIGVKLAQVLWRKFKPNEIEAADSNLIDIGFTPLVEENYQLAKVIFDFAITTLKKHSNDKNRLIFIVNRALAYKWSGDDKKAREIIEAEDWSAKAARFRLAEAVIFENTPNALKIMKEIGVNFQEVSQRDYKRWPLFKEIRKMPEFQQVYQEIFNESFNKVETEEQEISSHAQPPDGSTLEPTPKSAPTDSLMAN